MQYKKINIHLFSLILLSVFVSWGICLHFDSLANNTSLDFFTRLNSLLPNNENTLLVALGSVGTFFLLKIAFQTTISLKFGLIDGTLAFFLSFFTVIGGFFQANPPSSNLSVSNLSILFGIVKIIALTTLLTSTFISITSSQIVRQFHHTVNKKRNPYFIISIIILLAWIPYMIILFPGTGSWDTVNQIAEFFGTHVHNAYPTSYYLLQSGMSTLSDHHPVFLTLFFGGAVKLGLALGNPLLGIFFLSLFQCLYAIGICVFSIHVFRRMGMTAHTEKVLIIFYAFSPVFPLYSLFVVKNTLYGITIFWFCLLLLQFVQNSDETSHSISWILQVIVNLLLQTITVKYGLIVASLTSIVLLLSFRKKFIRLFAILAIPLIIFHVGYSTTLKLLNVTPGDPVESYALPFQQTARFVKNHPNDVTKKEKKVLNRVFYYDRIAKSYNPDIADPIKSSGVVVPETDQPVQDKIVYRYQTVTKKDLVEYRKVWLQQLFRHPGTYIIATLNGIYRYFDLDTHNGVGFGVTAAYPINIQQNSLRFKNNGTVFKISAFHPTSSLKYILVTMLTIINTVPFLNLFLLGAFYIVLVLLISVNLLFTKDRVNVVVLSPLLIQILVDSVSPVNGSQRYMYPLIFSASIIFFALIKLRKNLATDQDSKDNTLN